MNFQNRKGTYYVERQPPKVSLSMTKLDKLVESGICIVLTKAIEKLKIIQQLLPCPEVVWDELYQPMNVRMTKLQKIKLPEDTDPDSVVALKHVQRCRYMSQQAFEKVTQDDKGQSDGMLNCLKHVLFCENLKYYDEFLLKEKNVNLTNTIHNLRNKINEVERNSQETRLYLYNMTQFCLEQAKVTAWAQSQTASRNTTVALHAKAAQNRYQLKGKEENITNLREQYNLEIVKEDLINSEITNHLQEVTATLQSKLEKWTSRYSEEVDALDIALLQLRSKMDEQQEKFGTMTQQHSAKQELLQVLQSEADERDREQGLRLAQTKAALTIQHWWRQTLFMRLVHTSAKEKHGTKLSEKKSKKEIPKKKKK